MSKLNVDGMLMFEQPFARVPYEHYRHVFRSSQRYIERDMGSIQATLTKPLGKSSELSELEEALANIDNVMLKVSNLKQKLSDLQETSGRQTLSVLRARLSQLNSLSVDPSSDHSEFLDMRLDRWLVDWALRTGHVHTARAIAAQKNMETMVDIELFQDILRIEGKLRSGSCTEALIWCTENRSALKKLKSTLEFDLRLQEYVELLRIYHSDKNSANWATPVNYAKKHLMPWSSTHAAQINQALTLVVIPPDTPSITYKRLYDPARWDTLISTFRSAIYTLNNLPTAPLLHLALYAGLASLKLPACFTTHDTPDEDSQAMHSTSSLNCPVCTGFREIAREVPFSHHVNSTIVCGITGKVIEGEEGEPLCFPNGNVYSSRALEEMATRNNGSVICPRSGMVCSFEELKKVYIS